MKVLVTGSNGLIGREVIAQLTAAGHYAIRLVRANPDRTRGDVVWDPVSGKIERTRLNGVEAVIHLAGENILGLWTKAKKERVHRSRVAATEYLSEALAGLSPRPVKFVSASAIGYYGSRGDERLDEQSRHGEGFLATLCKEWEDATNLARHAGIHVVNARIGLVLSPRGGVLGSMVRPFRLGLGGPIGTGRHYMSWITIDDVVAGLLHVMEKPGLSGPVNFTAPNPVTNRQFTQTLAAVLRRPAFFPVPSLLLKALPGNMANETMLASARVQPVNLQKSGYIFRHPDLESGLRALLT